MKNKIVLASSNMGKIAELNELLADFPFEIISQKSFGIEDVPETGTTFVENAIIKARHAAQLTQLPALADDSGLVVDALQGAPGVCTARYGGVHATQDEKIQKLLDALKDVAKSQRSARFYSVIVLMRDHLDPAPIICQGVWEGEILFEKKDGHGFGYDPIFYVPTHLCSAAEMPMEIKNRISHRGRAIEQLKAAVTHIFL